MISKQLAEMFEVSRRTILRDIDSLCVAGIPVITIPGEGGGIMIQEGYKIDNALLSPDHVQGWLPGSMLLPLFI